MNFVSNITETQALGVVLLVFFGGALILPPKMWMRHWFVAAVVGAFLFLVDWLIGIGSHGVPYVAKGFFRHVADAAAAPSGVILLVGFAVLYSYLIYEGDEERIDTWLTGWSVLIPFALYIGGVGHLIGQDSIIPVGDIVALLVSAFVYVKFVGTKVSFELPFIFKGFRGGSSPF